MRRKAISTVLYLVQSLIHLCKENFHSLNSAWIFIYFELTQRPRAVTDIVKYKAH